jgi:hypothetical protein
MARERSGVLEDQDMAEEDLVVVLLVEVRV